MISVIADFVEADRWDAFVEAHPEGRFSQLWGYRCIESVYGYRPFYIAVEREGRLVGVLPTFGASSRLFGRRQISQPFSEYGGFLLDEALDEQQARFVLERVREMLRELGTPLLEIHGDQGHGPARAHLAVANPQQLACLDLTRSEEDLWGKVISRHVRKAVNKAEREGLTCVEDSDERTIASVFYPLYLRSMSRLGAPPHPLAYFTACRAALGRRMRIYWAVKDGTKIAGLLGFACGRRVSIVNIVSDERFWELRPNDLVHWEFVKWARTAGHRHFDFGSVRYAGQEQFKSKWGCEMVSSGYYLVAAAGRDAPPATFDSSGGTMTLASRLWTRVPAWAARWLGPPIRRNLMR
jgi:lipid II:glycine glycyltransferase (peptidoglycan interpeptide bridge formation enzyme)